MEGVVSEQADQCGCVRPKSTADVESNSASFGVIGENEVKKSTWKDKSMLRVSLCWWSIDLPSHKFFNPLLMLVYNLLCTCIYIRNGKKIYPSANSRPGGRLASTTIVVGVYVHFAEACAPQGARSIIQDK